MYGFLKFFLNNSYGYSLPKLIPARVTNIFRQGGRKFRKTVEIALDEGSGIKVSVKTRHALLDFINDGRGKLLFGGESAAASII